MWLFVCGWVSEWVRASVRLSRFALWARYYSFCLITFKLHMHIVDERRNPIDFRLRGQGHIWHSVYKTLWAWYRLQFLPNHFETSHAHCWWWEEEPYWFWVTGLKVKVNFGILYIRPCGHDTDYSFCPFTSKLYMLVVDDEGGTLLILGHVVKGQGQLLHSV